MNKFALLIVSAVLHGYVGGRVAPGLAAWPWAQGLFVGLVVVSTFLMPLGLISSRLLRQPWADRMSWAGLLLMGLFSSLLVLTALRDGVLLAVSLLGGLLPQVAVPAWQGPTAALVPAVGLLVTALGFLNARRTPQVVRVDVPIAGLPRALQGFTLAQISDIHVGPTIKSGYVQRIVNRVNGLKADVVAITGDLVDGTVPALAAQVAPLAGLQSRHGTFFVTGNHEYYSGAQAWVAELRRIGLNVLMNEHVVLHHGDAVHGHAHNAQGESQTLAPLVLAGVTDFTAHHFDETHRSSPEAAIKGAPFNAHVRVLLAHQPRSAAAALAAGFDLQLSGHTHGGQFWPWNLFVPLQQPFTAGLNRLNRLWVYTSRGTGYWGPPKRFGAPSEITVLRLVAG